MLISLSFGIVLAHTGEPKPATMFLVLLVVLPNFFYLPPYKIAGYFLIMVFVFCLLSYAYKPTFLANMDFTNAAASYVMGIAVSYMITSSRIKNTKSRILLEYACNLDELTQLYNRRHFNRYILDTYPNYENTSLVMMDIDYFKVYNDTYGHIQGDNCLIK